MERSFENDQCIEDHSITKFSRIMNNEKNQNTNRPVLVSICCLTYNHELYIEQCLKGFLSQQTDFAFEILIHDDASTDRTPLILKEYEKKYPDLIKVIYQSENQYSKGVNVHLVYNLPRVKGKYIAFCEGDDYWTKPYKLQKQIEFLETHPNYSLCCHHAQLLIQKTSEMKDLPLPAKAKYMNFSFLLRDWIKLGWFFTTASIVFRKDCIDEYFLNQFPDCKDAHVFYSLLRRGSGYFMKESMSVYRRHSGGVWSSLYREQQNIINLKTVYEIHRIEQTSYTREWVIMRLAGLSLFYIRSGYIRKFITTFSLTYSYLGIKGIVDLLGYVFKKMICKPFHKA